MAISRKEGGEKGATTTTTDSPQKNEPYIPTTLLLGGAKSSSEARGAAFLIRDRVSSRQLLRASSVPDLCPSIIPARPVTQEEREEEEKTPQQQHDDYEAPLKHECTGNRTPRRRSSGKKKHQSTRWFYDLHVPESNLLTPVSEVSMDDWLFDLRTSQTMGTLDSFLGPSEEELLDTLDCVLQMSAPASPGGAAFFTVRTEEPERPKKSSSEKKKKSSKKKKKEKKSKRTKDKSNAEGHVVVETSHDVDEQHQQKVYDQLLQSCGLLTQASYLTQPSLGDLPLTPQRSVTTDTPPRSRVEFSCDVDLMEPITLAVPDSPSPNQSAHPARSEARRSHRTKSEERHRRGCGDDERKSHRTSSSRVRGVDRHSSAPTIMTTKAEPQKKSRSSRSSSSRHRSGRQSGGGDSLERSSRSSRRHHGERSSSRRHHLGRHESESALVVPKKDTVKVLKRSASSRRSGRSSHHHHNIEQHNTKPIVPTKQQKQSSSTSSQKSGCTQSITESETSDVTLKKQKVKSRHLDGKKRRRHRRSSM